MCAGGQQQLGGVFLVLCGVKWCDVVLVRVRCAGNDGHFPVRNGDIYTHNAPSTLQRSVQEVYGHTYSSPGESVRNGILQPRQLCTICMH